MSDPANPASYPERVLLAVTGLSPQIVTETLYALAVLQIPPFIPTRIELLTTEEGRQRALVLLLDSDCGAFNAFCREYELPTLSSALTQDRIIAIRDASGQSLPDIQTDGDNILAADCITRHVRTLTADPATALHVSIAGGRKTMGFLAGHALSLFGRAQDRLSHVLVAEAFMTLPEFFYPPRRPRWLADRFNRPANTGEAQLMLADIPFLRLRDHLPPGIRDVGRSYSETISAAQSALDPSLEINLDARQVYCGGRVVRLPPAELAWLAWMAQRRQTVGLAHGGALHWTEAQSAELLALYRKVASGRDAQRMAMIYGDTIPKEVFEQRTAKVNKLVRDSLGLAAGPYLLVPDGQRPVTRTGLALSPDRIRLQA